MNFDFRFYWKLLVRRLPVMILFILVCSTLGVITALRLPETWSTSARLLVEAPQIPSNMVTSMVEIEAVEQLDIMEQRLMTRANLIDIANRLNVFEDIRRMTPDLVVQRMRAATRIRRSAGRSQATLMTIQFEARTGQIAAAVVNEFVTLVLEENTDIRVSRAENTLSFFVQEVARLDQELSRQSARIAEYKSENLSALPEDQTYRLGRQALLQERVSRLERDLSAATAQREELDDIFQRTGSIRAAGAGNTQRSMTEEQLLQAQSDLDQALAVYSDTHPRVAQIKLRISRLETAVAEERASAATTGPGGEETDATQDMSTEEAIFRATLSEVEGRIAMLNEDLEDTRQELTELQRDIARSAGVGIELSSLTRDYENIQARYNAAVNNLNNARMSERIETTARGQRINVIENANVPSVPSGPNRTKIAIMGAMMGVLLASGYFAALEFLNRTVRRPADLTNRFAVTPMVVIPYMEGRRDRLLRRGGILLATIVVLVGVPLGLWYVDTNYIPLEIVVQRGLAQLGLG